MPLTTPTCDLPSNRYMRLVTAWKHSSSSPSQNPQHPTDQKKEFFEGFPARYWLPAFFFPQGEHENQDQRHLVQTSLSPVPPPALPHVFLPSRIRGPYDIPTPPQQVPGPLACTRAVSLLPPHPHPSLAPSPHEPK